MTTRISHIPFGRRLVIPNRYLFVGGLIYALPVVLLYLWHPAVGVSAALIPWVIFLIVHAPSAVLVLIGATFLFFLFPGPVKLLPSDMAALVLIAAYLVDLFCRGPITRRNPMARPFLVYLTVMLISLSLAGFTAFSFRFFLRQVVLAGTFFAVAHFGPRLGVKRVLTWFVAAAAIHSLYSVGQFLAAGGAIRAFGLAGHGYGDHVMLTFLISAVFFLWATDIRARLLWGMAGLLSMAGLVATQTRASVLTAGWALVIAIVLILWTGRKARIKTPRKNLIWAVIALSFVGIMLVAYTPFFQGITSRFERIGPQASGTILLRFTLWKAALAAFLKYPVFGIGPGNYAMVGNWVPEVKFDPVFYLVSGLGTHAIVLTALAETGLMGLFALAFFFFRAIKTAYRNIIKAEAAGDLVIAQCLMVASLAIVGSSIYAGSWFWGNNSYHMAIIFGLVAAYRSGESTGIPEGAAL